MQVILVGLNGVIPICKLNKIKTCTCGLFL